jgi:hypothetical protein
MAKNTKIIQVPMEEELLKQIDTNASIVAESRSAFIREACQQRLKSLQAKELDRLYIEGHQKHPENVDWRLHLFLSQKYCYRSKGER